MRCECLLCVSVLLWKCQRGGPRDGTTETKNEADAVVVGQDTQEILTRYTATSRVLVLRTAVQVKVHAKEDPRRGCSED